MSLYHNYRMTVCLDQIVCAARMLLYVYHNPGENILQRTARETLERLIEGFDKEFETGFHTKAAAGAFFAEFGLTVPEEGSRTE